MNRPTRPDCRHWKKLPEGVTPFTTTTDPAAMLKALTTCSDCEIERLEDERDGYRSALADLVAQTRGYSFGAGASKARAESILVLKNGPKVPR